jgi:hypothetical protein
LVVRAATAEARVAAFRAESSLAMNESRQPVSVNRLAQAASPYLRQHAGNPVDWHEWGPEALARARRENRPIFLSIGYSACHWCHVMARESFANPDVAAVMNANFVNIKVDREERPDLDEIYLRATLLLNHGQGGWPMSVWLTPDLDPFFAGTYFPPTARSRQVGLMELCQAIGEAWDARRDEIVTHAGKLTEVLRESLQARPANPTGLSLAAVDEAAEMLADAFDPVSGGLISGPTNKFPPSLAIDLMLRSAARRPPECQVRKKLLELTELTLGHMAAGGICDQLGGGFHRYSTDVEWHVPHFEKMLYDQALVSRAYLDAYQLTGRPLYAVVVRRTLDYVLADLRSAQGGFYSSRDADSEGGEGRYYVWTRAEVLEAVGPEDGELFCAHYDVREGGNWNDPHQPLTERGAIKGQPRAARNVLRELRDHECCAKFYGITPQECAERLARGRAKLLAARAKRVPPGLDNKILCEWNGLMIGSLARAGCALDQTEYVQAAARAAGFILDQRQNGRLRRSYHDGRALGPAFLSDYAGLIEGLIELYEATFQKRWLEQAAELNRVAIEHYWDPAEGGFYFTPNDHEPLIARSKDLRDAVVPSGNSVQLMNLLRLSALLGDQELRSLADRTMAAFAGQVLSSPWAAERFLAGVDFALAGPTEVAVIGDPAAPQTRALLRQVYETYLPNRLLALHNPARPADSIASPLLADRGMVQDRPTAYVCRNHVCQQPATTPQELAQRLG